MAEQLDALVIAGGTPPPEDPFYVHTQGAPRSLVDVAGKPMAQWVLDALGGARRVADVVVIGVDSSSALTCEKPLSFMPDHGSLLANVQAGLTHIHEQHPEASHALIVSADIPAITPEMVDWRVERALQAGKDIDYSVVERSVMEARFPGSNRSYVRLKDVEVCGGDMNAVRLSLVNQLELWERIIASRKHPILQAALLGFDTLLLILLRAITLDKAVERVTRKLGLTGAVHLSPYAEIAMDVDKPHQLEILRRDLAARGGASS